MATFYVATTGNDANNGTSPALAKLTVTAGCALLAGGDTLIIGAGTYNEGILDNVPSGASWGAPTTIQAATGTTVWLAPTGGSGYANVVLFDGAQQFIQFLNINLDATRGITQGCVYLRGWSGGNPNHIRFNGGECIGPTNGVINEGTAAFSCFELTSEVGGLTGGNELLNLTVHGCGDSGDYSAAFNVQTSDNLISNCNAYDSSGNCIVIQNVSFGINNNIVRNTLVHDVSRSPAFSSGIFLGPGTGSQIYNNVIYNLSVSGGGNAALLVATGGSDAAAIYQNTVTANAMIGIHLSSGSGGTVVENNIAYGNTPNNLVDDASSTLTTNLVGVNPVFVNPSGNNFQLTVGSPAIDAGTTNAYTTDILGVTRPQGSAFDIGAYEFVVGPAPNDLWAASVM
jgi:parallel beta-helix repeat protein